MDRVFGAMVERFKADAELKKLAKRMYLGTGEDHDPPYVVAEFGPSEDLDAFDVDITIHPVTFTIVTGGTKPTKHGEAVRAFLRVFDDASIEGGEFDIVACTRTSRSGPNRTDDGMQWESSIDYDVTVELARMTPALRGA